MTLSLNKIKSLKFSEELKEMGISAKELFPLGKNYDDILVTIKQQGNKKLEKALKEWYWHSDRRLPIA